MAASTETKQQMAQARALIESKDYDGARRILAKVDHPKAREWEQKLEARLPTKKPSNLWKWVVGIAVVLVIVAGALYIYQISENTRESTRRLALDLCSDQYKVYSNEWQNCMDSHDNR